MWRMGGGGERRKVGCGGWEVGGERRKGGLR